MLATSKARIMRLMTCVARRRSEDVSKTASGRHPMHRALKIDLDCRCWGIDYAPQMNNISLNARVVKRIYCDTKRMISRIK